MLLKVLKSRCFKSGIVGDTSHAGKPACWLCVDKAKIVSCLRCKQTS